MSNARWTAAIVLFLSLGFLRAAVAESPEATLQRAVGLYRSGEFDRSRALLERVLSPPSGVDRTPAQLRARAHLYLGLNEAAAGRLSKTRRHFTDALRLDPGIEVNRDHLKTEVVEILDRLLWELRGVLVIESNIAQAMVVVDGQAVGTTPYRGEHRLGRHQVELRSPGAAPSAYLAHRTEVVLGAGATRRLSVTLLPLNTAKARPHRTKSPDLVTGPFDSRRQGTRPADDGRGRALRRWAWITAAGALATGGTAVGLGFVALGRRDGADAFALTGDPASVDDQQRHLELVDSAKQMATGCNVAWGVAGALAVTSAVLFVWDLIDRPR